MLELNNMSNTKLNVYKKVLHEACEKFNGVEECIKEELKCIVTKANYQQER